jgi:hypothetical protein
VATGCDGCTVRVPGGAVCALVPAADNTKVPAKAANIAAVLTRIMTPTQCCYRRNVSDWPADVNCTQNRVRDQ